MIKTTANIVNDGNKKNRKDKEEIVTIVLAEETRNLDSEALLSPPKKKRKEEPLSFPKLTKEEAEKQAEQLLQSQSLHLDNNSPAKKSAVHIVNSTEQLLKSPVHPQLMASETTTPISKSAAEENPATPASSKKKSPLVSKEERQKAKELKEQQKLQRQQELEEKRRKREEEKLLKQQEKEKREQERKEKERLREVEKIKREEEKRIRDEQKEMERRRKEEQKEIEVKKREAEKERKEGERKEKEEQKKAEEEALRKKKEKAANQFKSFFTKTSSVVKKEDNEEYQRFKPLELKPNMILAPVCRSTLTNKQHFDKLMDQVRTDLPTYLNELAVKLSNIKKVPYLTRCKVRKDYEERKKGELLKKKQEKHIDGRKHVTSAIERPSHEVVILKDSPNKNLEDEEDEEDDTDGDNSYTSQQYMKAKLLQFSENTRPAFYGTWRKTSKTISGRRPFLLDTDSFNYDVDSDEEWIDEPGEDCSDAGDEDDEDDKETEDDNDGFFVPHGYLSDDEGIKDSDEDGENEKDFEDKNNKIYRFNSESRAEDKLRVKVCSFEDEFKKKLKPRKAVCVGICYDVAELPNMLKEYCKVNLFKSIVDKTELIEELCDESRAPQIRGDFGNQTPMTVPEEAMEYLIRFLHGNTNGIRKIIDLFKDYWNCYVSKHHLNSRAQISKRQLERKIQAIASRSHNAELSKSCYTVNREILEKYKLIDLKLGEGVFELKAKGNNETKIKVVGVDMGMKTDISKDAIKIYLDKVSPMKVE